LNYESSGVNISKADDAKKEFSKILDNQSPTVLNKVGAFASLIDISNIKYRHPILVFKTEEPGSKQLLAFKYNKIRSICFDIINHLTNDVICMGAKPIAIQDAIICGKLEKEKVIELVQGMSDAAKSNDTVLTGGETSEQPRVIENGRYILTASMIGIVEKYDIIDGLRIHSGNVILALPSNGIHTNGYSLIRSLIDKDESILKENIGGETFLEQIMKEHTPYYHCLKGIFSKIHGIAHITGGGIHDNLKRIIPEKVMAEIDLNKIKILPIFKFLKEVTNSSDTEMLKTFNNGVGMVIVVPFESVGYVLNHLKMFKVEAYEIGRITKGSGISFINELNW